MRRAFGRGSLVEALREAGITPAHPTAPGLLEIWSIKPLGEPAVDLCQALLGRLVLGLSLPQSAKAHHRPQLPGFAC